MDWFQCDNGLRHERLKQMFARLETIPEAYSELSQTSKIEHFAKIVNG